MQCFAASGTGAFQRRPASSSSILGLLVTLVDRRLQMPSPSKGSMFSGLGAQTSRHQACAALSASQGQATKFPAPCLGRHTGRARTSVPHAARGIIYRLDWWGGNHRARSSCSLLIGSARHTKKHLPLLRRYRSDDHHNFRLDYSEVGLVG